jgi:hypothetical protein
MATNTSIHEAGHAVVAVAVGVGLRTKNKVGLSIVPAKNGAWGGFCRSKRWGNDETGNMVVSLAGGMAQHQINSQPFEDGIENDILDLICAN